MVVSGVDPAQIKCLSVINDKIDKSSNRILNKAYSMACIKTQELIKRTDVHSQNHSYRDFINGLCLSGSCVTTLFPFLYLDYDVGDIKRIIKEKLVGMKKNCYIEIRIIFHRDPG